MKRICVFCGSSPGVRPAYGEAARAFASVLVRRGIGVVYGGGCVGLMGILADAMIAGGGEVIGVIPEALVQRELAHRGVHELRIVRSMHERKAMMADLADGFVALPGGYGTFEELCEVITWSQLGLHRKPCGILNVEGYFDPLLRLFDHAVVEGFVTPAYRSIVVDAQEPELLLDTLAAYRFVPGEKWIDRENA